MSRHARISERPPGGGPGPGLPLEDAGAGGGAGTGVGASTISTAPGRSCKEAQGSRLPDGSPRGFRKRPIGSSRCSKPAAAGVSRAGAMTILRGWVAASRPLRRPPGRCSAWWPPAEPAEMPPARGWPICRPPNARMEPGMKARIRGQDFPRSSIFKYHLYRIYFPLMAIARYQAAVGRVPVATPGAQSQPDSGLARAIHHLTQNQARSDPFNPGRKRCESRWICSTGPSGRRH